MGASIWDGSSAIDSTANADNSYISQRFVATAGQTLFILTAFAYEPGTGSVFVEIGGAAGQYIGIDYRETSRTSVTLVEAAELGDIVVIRGLVGSTGAQAAGVSAIAAEAAAAASSASAANATSAATAASNSATSSATSATAAAGSAIAAAASAVTAASYTSGISTQVTDFVQNSATTTGLTYGYKAGVIRIDNVTTAVAAGTIALTNTATNYVEVTGSGVVSTNTTGFTAGRFPMATIVTSGGVITSVTDKRGIINIAPSGITNIIQSATSLTLTTVQTLVVMAPTTYGVSVTLQNAATDVPKVDYHRIDNQGGAFPVRILDSTGVLKGFVLPGASISISLLTASAAGVWSLQGASSFGASLQLITAIAPSVNMSSIDLGGGREILIGTEGTAFLPIAVVVNNITGSWGTPTIIRAVNTGSLGCRSILVSTDKVLVISCPSGSTAFEAVILTVTGTSFVVGLPVPITLSANLAGYAESQGLIQVGSSFVTSYYVADGSSSCQLRAITVSGTTPAVGNAVTLTGTAVSSSKAAPLVTISSVVIAASTLTTHLYTEPFTVSGSTLTLGTGTDTNSGTMTLNKFFALGSRACVLYNDGGSTVKGGVVSLTSTTTTITTATLFSAGTLQDAMLISSSKVLALNSAGTLNANILTDTAGTASAGTAITGGGGSATTRACVSLSGTSITVQEGTTSCGLWKLNCSGVSPVLIGPLTTVLSNTEFPEFAASDRTLSRSLSAVYTTAYARTVQVTGTQNFNAQISGGIFSRHVAIGVPGTAFARGKTASEVWVTDSNFVITKVECVV